MNDHLRRQYEGKYQYAVVIPPNEEPIWKNLQQIVKMEFCVVNLRQLSGRFSHFFSGKNKKSKFTSVYQCAVTPAVAVGGTSRTNKKDNIGDFDLLNSLWK